MALLVGSTASSHFTVYPPKLDVLKGDALGFEQEIQFSFKQEEFDFDDEASILGDDSSSFSDSSDFEQDELVDSEASISLDSNSTDSELDDTTAFEQAKKKKKGGKGKKHKKGGKKHKKVSQERVQFEEMARTHALAKAPNMTQARLNGITHDLWAKYVASKN